MKGIVLKKKDSCEKISVLQITDTHLFADSSTNFLGVNTYDSLRAVMDTIKNQGLHYDFVCMTGDISQDYTEKSYQIFARMMDELEAPIVVVPGNHDSIAVMQQELSKTKILLDRHIICHNWQFIMLNSVVKGLAHGFVEESELNFLRESYNKYPDLFTVVCVHHLPKKVGSKWLDTQTMHNQDDFNALLKELPNVKLVLSGHVHQEFDKVIDNIRYIASPSTSIQFEPLSENFSLDHEGPGWRYLTFNNNGSIDTMLCRLPIGRFIPDNGIEGY